MEKGTAVLGAGTRLGEYEIERVLGVGSMGAVYEAVCTATSQRFAIKVLSPALAAMPTARARFLNEAKLTARVRHPHIVDVSDVGEDAGRSYFVMELLNGEDLSRRLQRSGRLSVVETADIIVPVCDAVAEAHRRGVTHRDLKPSNIFLLIRGRRPHPVVLDFGIAKEEDAARAPRAGAATPVRRTVFGTPYYLAPEQVADHEAAGPASDQYALGVILYECLTGQPPYRGDNVDAVFRAIAAGNPAPPIALRPDIPQEMNAVVLRALSPDPKARYLSVGELRQALLPFSSKATGSVPTLQSRGPAPSASPLSASPSPSPLSPSTEPAPSPPSEVEVQAPRSFVRTLTPEVEALEGAWFAAGEVPQESAGETAIPSPIAGRESEWEPSGVTVPPVEVESAASGAASGIARLVSRRISDRRRRGRRGRRLCAGVRDEERALAEASDAGSGAGADRADAGRTSPGGCAGGGTHHRADSGGACAERGADCGGGTERSAGRGCAHARAARGARAGGALSEGSAHRRGCTRAARGAHSGAQRKGHAGHDGGGHGDIARRRARRVRTGAEAQVVRQTPRARQLQLERQLRRSDAQRRAPPRLKMQTQRSQR